MELRYLNKLDTNFLHRLRNEEEVRKNSRSPAEVTLENHTKWVRNAITDKDIIPMVIWEKETRIGQLNLKKVSVQTCEVSISITKNYRGKGYAKKALTIAHRVAKQDGYRQVLAEVKRSNTASQKLFEGQGYKKYFTKGQLITLIKEI